MSMKDIFKAYEKQYRKQIGTTPAKRESQDLIWVDMATSIRMNGKNIRDELRREHSAIEDAWLKANVAFSRTSDEFKALANAHIRERNSFARPYKLEPESEL